jgi:hypothetical protein
MVMVLLCCRYVEGGMGSVSMAVAKAAAESGATLATNAEVNNQCRAFLYGHIVS